MKFKEGDKVTPKKAGYLLQSGQVYTVKAADDFGGICLEGIRVGWFLADDFEHAKMQKANEEEA